MHKLNPDAFGIRLLNLCRHPLLAIPTAMFVNVALFMLVGMQTAQAVRDYSDQREQQQALEKSLQPVSVAGRYGQYLDELRQALVPGAGLKAMAEPVAPDWSALERDIAELDQAFMAEWRHTQSRFQRAGVDTVILERHQETRNLYQQRLKQFRQHIKAQDQQGLTAMLSEMQTRPTHKVNDFSQPSFGVLEPDSNNQPGSEAVFTKLASERKDGPLTPRKREPAYPVPFLKNTELAQYLGETPEVVITPAIEAKAAELNHDPIAIYHFVRNQIDYLPNWGATQDAELTLGARRGNAMDISTLLIALLRASDIPARYVHGVMETEAAQFQNWMGNFSHVSAAMQHASAGGIPVGANTQNNATIDRVTFEHVWVEAAIDYIPSGGLYNNEADTWVALDASFKQYQYLQGLDAIAIAELDVEQLAEDFANSGTINEEMGYVQGLDTSLLEQAQADVREAMEAFIEDQMEDPTTGDVIGGRKAIELVRPEFTVVPDNPIALRGSSYASLPDGLRHSLRVTFDVDYLTRQPTGGVVLPWASVNNHRLTLSYRPATQADEDALLALLPEGEITDLDQLPQSLPGHSIRFTPELKLNGEIILTGPTSTDPMTMETTFAFEVQRVVGNQKHRTPYFSPVPKGSYLAIMANAGSVSTHALEAAQQRAEEAQYILENELEDQYEEITRETLMGDLFYAGVLGYQAQLEGFGGLMAAQMNAEYGTGLSVGTYGYQPWVRYVMGVPMALDAGGVHMDLDSVPSHLTAVNGSQTRRSEAVHPVGILKSLLESVVPEQQFSTEEEPAQGVSAVSAIAMAAEQGQRIFYITEDNLDEALAQVSISAESRQDIRRGVLNHGMKATVHEAPITVPGWRGSGYILTHPETGAGSYMVDGGKNGSYLLGLLLGSVIILAIVLALVLVPAMAATGALILTLIAEVVVGAAIVRILSSAMAMEGFDMGCFVVGLLTPFLAIGVVLGGQVLGYAVIGSGGVIGKLLAVLGIGSFAGKFTPMPSDHSCLSGVG